MVVTTSGGFSLLPTNLLKPLERLFEASPCIQKNKEKMVDHEIY
jgi:hypothetical protein